MRWIALLVALCCAPVSFGDHNTEEETSVSSVERGGCPGGVCRPGKRPRPKR
jgi:hypothetical protein